MTEEIHVGLFDAIKNLFTFNYKVLESAPALTPEQERGLAFGAVYAVERRLPINALTMESEPKAAAVAARDVWNAVDTASARETYRNLLDVGHRPIYQLVRPYVDDVLIRTRRDNATFRARAERELPELAGRYGLDPDMAVRCFRNYCASAHLLQASLPKWLPHSIVAWDAAQVVHVSRLFVDAGFIAPDEAWSTITRAVELSRPRYSSWAEFSDAFLVGRAFWHMGAERFDALKTAQDIEIFADAAGHLLARTDGPWRRLPW